MKPIDMEDTDWTRIKENGTKLIHLCAYDEGVYHILDLTTPKEVWVKLESVYV